MREYSETIEKEWLERHRYDLGKPTGYRTYRTELDEVEYDIESAILVIAGPMEARNREKHEHRDKGVFYKESLEEMFVGKDGKWRYTVGMKYVPSDSEVRKKQAKKI